MIWIERWGLDIYGSVHGGLCNHGEYVTLHPSVFASYSSAKIFLGIRLPDSGLILFLNDWTMRYQARSLIRC